MTEHIKSFLFHERFWLLFFRIAPTLGVIAIAALMFWGDGRYVTHDRLAEQLAPIVEHVESTTVHMPYREKIIEFVPRTEYERRHQDLREMQRDDMKEIKALLLRLEQKIEKARE
jgi:hypothetical protein